MTNPPKWLRVFFAVFPFLSLFFFPWPMTLIASVAAGLVFPPLPLLVGILIDVLYAPGGWPLGTSWGLGIAAVTYAVRHIIKTRIM